MSKVKLQLGAELDLLNKGELDDALFQHDAWVRDAAYGVKQQDIPRMIGTVSGTDITLGGDQADQPQVGPKSGWYWAVHRISVYGLASGDVVQVWNQFKYIGLVSYNPGYITFGKGQFTMKTGDYLRVIGTGLTATGQIEVYGEAVSAPGPMMWKLFS